MKISTKWQQNQRFIATTATGHELVMDGNGGAPSPLELILAAVGGCSSIDVVMILQKGRHEITDCHCELMAERADAVPSVFTKINAHYVVSGNNLKLATVQRACELSIQKYCSAAIMLNKSVEISFSCEIKEN